MTIKKGLVAACLFAMAASSHAVLIQGAPTPPQTLANYINFDDQATGTVLGAADYAAQGVTITENTGAGAAFARYAGSQSSPNYVGTGAGYEIGGAALGWDGLFEFNFGGKNTNEIGIGVADSAGNAEILSVYDVFGNLIESHALGVGANTYWFIQAANIGSVQLLCDFCAFDDFQFNTLVPEPGTLLLLGIGLAGFGVSRRKRA